MTTRGFIDPAAQNFSNGVVIVTICNALIGQRAVLKARRRRGRGRRSGHGARRRRGADACGGGLLRGSDFIRRHLRKLGRNINGNPGGVDSVGANTSRGVMFGNTESL